MTNWIVVCTASDRSEVTLTLSVPVIGKDTWHCDDVAAWGLESGSIASWAEGSAFLHGVGSQPMAELIGFTKEVYPEGAAVGPHKGTGSRTFDEGAFPSGEFRWLCTART